ncbi:hypothetical protein, partial [Streptomyces europaeiscabiei]|uniref:hypothetical protein n=1 Tax=Streptomyces europaeiscabiei TaxID=146819 RepID=UPI0038F6BF3E
FPGRGLQSCLDVREAADPFVDEGEADGREVVGVDADVELVPVGAVIAGMRVTVQQRDDGAQRISPELLIEVPQVAGLG